MTTILNAPLGQQTTPTAAEGVPLSDDYYALLVDIFRFAPDGTMINGKLSVTVASNNITVALKGQDGNDPSATNPVGVKINGTWRRCTAALSITKNAATNWANAGSSELATNEIDWFPYAIWNTTPATDIVDLGFARIPFGRVYSDFSGTTTNEKYLATANASAPTSTDDCVVIGRFAATLSATASFNWSVPSFTNANLINTPIYETRRLNWTPTLTGFSANPTSTVYQYVVRGRFVDIYIREGADGTSNATSFTETLPFTALTLANALWMGPGSGVDNSAALTTTCRLAIGSGVSSITMNPNMSPTSTWTAGSTGKRIAAGNVSYPIG